MMIEMLLKMVIQDRLMATISTAGKEQTTASEKVLDTAAGKNKMEAVTSENVKQNVKEMAKEIGGNGSKKVVKWDYAVLRKTPGEKDTKWDYTIEMSGKTKKALGKGGTKKNVEQSVKKESAKKIEDKGKAKVVKWDYAVLTKTAGGKETKWDYLIEMSKTNKTEGEKGTKVDDDHTGRVDDAWDYSMEITSKD